MPAYEMNFLFRQMDKSFLVKTVRRSAEAVMDFGGYLKSIQLMHHGELSRKLNKHNSVHTHGSLWLMECELPPSKVEPLHDLVRRDIDVLRFLVIDPAKYTPIECQMHEETLPAPLRADVQSLVEASERKANKNRWRFYHGLDYYPFQR